MLQNFILKEREIRQIYCIFDRKTSQNINFNERKFATETLRNAHFREKVDRIIE